MYSTTEPAEPSPDGRPPVDRLTYRIDDLAAALGVSRRIVERERSAGRLPKPDLRIGRIPLWRIESVKEWIARGGR
jgi:predicted DNA-binding transcriptional regulator AlpA